MEHPEDAYCVVVGIALETALMYILFFVFYLLQLTIVDASCNPLEFCVLLVTTNYDSLNCHYDS